MSQLRKVDSIPADIDKHEVLLFSCVRNEEFRLPYFLEYYRSMGVDRFFFVDNNSSDNTAELLLSQPDCHLFQTDGSYAGSNYGMDWINQLLDTYADGHWALTVDADEQFIFPFFENNGLQALTSYLDMYRYDAIVCFLLDMYSDKAIQNTRYIPGEPFLDACPYFDSDTYTYKAFPKRICVPIRGGVRQRVFWKRNDPEKPAPYLLKFPFIKWKRNLYYEASTHKINGLSLADISGVLLHFKLFSDFIEYTKEESQREEHFSQAFQYKLYNNVMTQEPDINPMYPGSVKFTGSKQLTNMKLMFSSKRFNKNIGQA